jgi:signal transduction histidine kinase
MKSQQVSPRLLAHLRDLAVHDHLCAICNSAQEELSAALLFIRYGLERGQRCVYITSENKPASVLKAARRHGIDVESALKKGALILTHNKPYLKHGSFDAKGVIRYFTRAVRQAKKAGFSAFRIVGEMSWARAEPPGSQHLIDYEVKVHEFLRDNDALALCLYNSRRFPKALILDVIRTHPLVVYNGLVRSNPYFIAPAEFRRRNMPGVLIKRYMEMLKEHEQNTQALRELSATILQLHDEERRRLARELHDSTGQKLAELVMALGSMKGSVARLRPRLRRKFSNSLNLARQAGFEVSTLSFLLHPPVLEHSGLAEALRWFVRGFSQRSGIKVSLHLQDRTERLPRELETTLLRIAQEALHNVQRHSRSKRAQVRLRVDKSRAVLQVRDFGRGFPLRNNRREIEAFHVLGVGISGMRERVQQLGGELQLTSVRPGALLRAIVPIPQTEKIA